MQILPRPYSKTWLNFFHWWGSDNGYQRGLDGSLSLGPDLKAFTLFAEDLKLANPGVFSFQIQPSAVINQVYPAGTAPIGLGQSAAIYYFCLMSLFRANIKVSIIATQANNTFFYGVADTGLGVIQN